MILCKGTKKLLDMENLLQWVFNKKKAAVNSGLFQCYFMRVFT